MKNSNIEWCDHTFNPWIGCTKVSPGCANCYAEAMMDMRMHFVEWGKGKPRKRTTPATWNDPVKWNRQYDVDVPIFDKGGFGKPPRPRVFCASLADWLDDEVPNVWRYDLLDLIRKTPNIDWLLLTKRPENFFWLMRDSMNQCSDRADDFIHEWLDGNPPANVWVGTTVEDQQRADERIPELISIPARVRFLSCEPLLQSVDIKGWIQGRSERMINWVICGGESGHDARPMHPDWARSLRDQCKVAGVPFLFKQWGEWAPSPDGGLPDSLPSSAGYYFSAPHAPSKVWRFGKKAAGRLLDGVEHNEFPEVKI